MNQPFTGTSGPAAAPCERGFMLTPLEWLGVERAFSIVFGGKPVQWKMAACLLKADGAVVRHAELARVCGITEARQDGWKNVRKGVERLRDLLGDRGLQDVVLTHLGRGYSIPAEHADVLLGDLFYATSLSLPPLQSIEREAA